MVALNKSHIAAVRYDVTYKPQQKQESKLRFIPMVSKIGHLSSNNPNIILKNKTCFIKSNRFALSAQIR